MRRYSGAFADGNLDRYRLSNHIFCDSMRWAALVIAPSIFVGCATVTPKDQAADQGNITPSFVAACTQRALDAQQTLGSIPRPMTGEPTVFRTDTVAHDVAEARCYVRDMAWHYTQKEIVAGHDTKWYFDVPLIGTAIAGAGAVLYRANLDVVGGAGLAAGGLSASKSYFHPDTNQKAYLSARSELMCIYDQTHVLSFVDRTDILYSDKAALRAAISDLIDKAGPLLAQDQTSGTATEKATAKAAQTSLDAGNKALHAVNSTLSDYTLLPNTIYQYADQIDSAGLNASLTTSSYASIYATIKDSVNTTLENKSTTKDARDALLKAQASAPPAGKPAQKPKAAKGDDAGKATATANLTKPAALADAKVPAAFTSCKSTEELTKETKSAESAKVMVAKCPGKPNDPAKKENTPPAITALSEPDTNAITKLNQVTAIALDDLPDPSFSELRTNIATCVQPQN